MTPKDYVIVRYDWWRSLFWWKLVRIADGYPLAMECCGSSRRIRNRDSLELSKVTGIPIGNCPMAGVPEQKESK